MPYDLLFDGSNYHLINITKCLKPRELIGFVCGHIHNKSTASFDLMEEN